MCLIWNCDRVLRILYSFSNSEQHLPKVIQVISHFVRGVLRKLKPKRKFWQVRKAQRGDRSSIRKSLRRKRAKLTDTLDAHSPMMPGSRSALLTFLTKEEARKCFIVNNEAHWAIEEDGLTSKKVRMAGSHGMPAQFCLERNYENTARMLLGIRDRMNSNLKNHFIKRDNTNNRRNRWKYDFDFATIDHISPAAALVFAAEYDRARQFLPRWSLKVYNRSLWKPSVVATLEQLGFFDLLNISVEPNLLATRQLQMTRFLQSEVIAQQQAHGFLAQLAALIGVKEGLNQRIGRLRLYEAIVEATENTMTHAYEESPRREEFVAKRWWMTGAVDPAEGKLTVVVYDQGATIPVRLP